MAIVCLLYWFLQHTSCIALCPAAAIITFHMINDLHSQSPWRCMHYSLVQRDAHTGKASQSTPTAAPHVDGCVAIAPREKRTDDKTTWIPTKEMADGVRCKNKSIQTEFSVETWWWGLKQETLHTVWFLMVWNHGLWLKLDIIPCGNSHNGQTAEHGATL